MSNEIEESINKLRNRKLQFEKSLALFISSEMKKFNDDTNCSIGGIDINIVNINSLGSSKPECRLNSVECKVETGF